MRYIIFVIAGPNSLATSEEMTQIDIFNEKIINNGNWITAAGISGANSSTLIDNRGDKGEVVKKSLVETPENYSGFWIIEAESDEVALQIAKEGSEACNRKVELRPFLTRS